MSHSLGCLFIRRYRLQAMLVNRLSWMVASPDVVNAVPASRHPIYAKLLWDKDAGLSTGLLAPRPCQLPSGVVGCVEWSVTMHCFVIFVLFVVNRLLP